MKEKRRDNKGRILHTGESQRTDGKYLYKYVDAFGNTKYVYAWRLTPTDPTPKGKREKPSLRELEQQIRRDIEDGIDSTGKKMTLCQLYAKQNAQRANVKKSTQKQREQLMRLLKEDKLGARSIDTIKPSDAKEWALRMKDKGFSYNTINNHKRSLKASFYIAIQDDYVRKNVQLVLWRKKCSRQMRPASWGTCLTPICCVARPCVAKRRAPAPWKARSSRSKPFSLRIMRWARTKAD